MVQDAAPGGHPRGRDDDPRLDVVEGLRLIDAGAQPDIAEPQRILALGHLRAHFPIVGF